MSKSLYNIQEEYLNIFREIEDNEGEVDEELYSRLVITQEDFKVKVENYCKYIRTLENQELFAINEIKRIQDYIRPKANLIDRLKETLLQAIKMFGDKDEKKDIWRFEVGTFRLGTRQSKSVTILDETLIEDRFKEIAISKLSLEDKARILDALGKSQEELTIIQTIPKTAIKKAIEEEGSVQGAELDTNYSLQIK